MYVYCGIIIFITHRHLSHSGVDKTRFSVHKFTEWLCTKNWLKKKVCYLRQNIFFVRKGGVNYLGQDQDSYGGGFSSKQSWSGTITQVHCTVLYCTVLSVLYCTVLYCIFKGASKNNLHSSLKVNPLPLKIIQVFFGKCNFLILLSEQQNSS